VDDIEQDGAGKQQKFAAGKMEMKQLQEAQYMTDLLDQRQ
jgi:hypothetical protein